MNCGLRILCISQRRDSTRRGLLITGTKNVAARGLAVPIERGPDNRAFIS